MTNENFNFSALTFGSPSSIDIFIPKFRYLSFSILLSSFYFTKLPLSPVWNWKFQVHKLICRDWVHSHTQLHTHSHTLFLISVSYEIPASHISDTQFHPYSHTYSFWQVLAMKFPSNTFWILSVMIFPTSFLKSVSYDIPYKLFENYNPYNVSRNYHIGPLLYLEVQASWSVIRKNQITVKFLWKSFSKAGNWTQDLLHGNPSPYQLLHSDLIKINEKK